MKKLSIICGLLACFGSSALWASYSENFNSLATGRGGLTLNNGSYFGASGTNGTAVGLGDYFGAADADLFSIGEGVVGDNHLVVGAIANAPNNLWRTMSVLIDASTFNVGVYDYAFEVEGFAPGTNAATNQFRIYEIKGLDTASERIQFVNSGNGLNPANVPYHTDTSSGPFDFSMVDQENILGNGAIAGTFNIGTARTSGDYYMLTWLTHKPQAGTSSTFTVDNISIVPEVGTYALWFGFAALALVARRRRRD